MKSHITFSLITLALSTAFVSTNVQADDEDAPLEITAEAGVLITTGNTESSSFFGKLKAAQNFEDWKTKYSFDYLKKENTVTGENGSEMTQTTDNRYTLTGQGDYKLGPKSAVFVFGSYASDEYGAYSDYTTLAGGYSFRAFKKQDMYLDVNVGPGYAWTETQDGTKQDGFVGRASGAFNWKFSPSAKFTQNISIEYADFNSRTITESAVQATLTDKMNMKFSYKTITNSDVQPGLEKTDTETAVTVVVNF
jgi:putative salt-induced outer membrane protein